MEKLAVDSLKMSVDEYRQMRETHSQEWIVDELQKRSLTKGLTTYDLRTLRDALLRNQTIANRTHQEWQPAEVRNNEYPYSKEVGCPNLICITRRVSSHWTS